EALKARKRPPSSYDVLYDCGQTQVCDCKGYSRFETCYLQLTEV
ncbi:hypothetical protein NPIL_357201, partial [Nephila pilipes]